MNESNRRNLCRNRLFSKRTHIVNRHNYDQMNRVNSFHNVTMSRAEKSLLRHDKSVHVSRLALLKYVEVRRLIGGQVLGQISDAALSVILTTQLLLARSEGPTNTRLMHMVVAAAIPLLIAGPVAGWLADHFSRRTILVSGQFLRVALSATLIFVLIADWSGTAAVLWALGLCTNRVLYNARIASVRHVVRDHELVAANSLSLMLSSVSGVVGASMAILASRYLGSTAMILVIVGHSVAVLMWCRIRTPLGGGAEHVEVTWAEVVKQFRHAKTRYSIVATSSHRLIFGGLLAATALRVDSLATGTTIAFGSVVACNGLGSFLGTLSAEWVNEHLHRKPLTVLTFAATATSTGLSCALDDRFSYLTNVLLVAFFFQNLRLCTDATIQSNARRGAGGRTFAAYDLSYNIAFLAGIVTTLAFETNVGAITLMVVATFAASLGTAGLFVMRRADSDQDETINESDPRPEPSPFGNTTQAERVFP